MGKEFKMVRWVFLGLVALIISLPDISLAQWLRRVDDSGVIYYSNTSTINATYTEPESTLPAKQQQKAKPVKPPVNTSKRKQTIEKEHARQQAAEQRKCDRLQAKMQSIEQKLDDGYREPRGNTLRRQRRDVKSQLFRDCS